MIKCKMKGIFLELQSLASGSSICLNCALVLQEVVISTDNSRGRFSILLTLEC